jgi:HSP20 family protein
MFAVSSRSLHHPAYRGMFNHVDRRPLHLVDAMLADWLSTPATAGASAPASASAPVDSAAAPATSPSVTTLRVLKARVEVVETTTGYQLRADLPGVRKQDIEIDVDGTQVTLRATLPPAAEHKDGDKLLYSERQHQAYERSLELPQAVDPAHTSARFEDGVLTLDLPRLAPLRSTRISID